MSPASVVITGSSGYLGTALVSHLIAQGNNKIVCIDKNIPPEKGNFNRKSVYFRQLDLKEKESCKKAFQELASISPGPKTVIHLAGLFVKNFKERDRFNGQDYQRNNTQALQNLLSTLPDIERLIFLSTAFLYHNSNDSQEGTLDAYAQTKKECEDLVKASGIPWVICRSVRIIGLPQRFGSNPSDNVPFDIVSSFILAAIKSAGTREKVKIKPANLVRSYIHIDDITKALNYILTQPEIGNQTVNLTTSSPVSLGKIWHEVATRLRHKGLKVEAQIENSHYDDIVRCPYSEGFLWKPKLRTSQGAVAQAADEYIKAIFS